MTLILTTHDMDEAALLADRVGIMDHGRLLALDTPDALISSLEGEGTLELTADQAADGTVVDALAALAGVERVETVQLLPRTAAAGPPPSRSRSGCASTSRATRRCASRRRRPSSPSTGCALQDVKLGTPTLEDVFIHLTGRTLR